MNRLVAAGDIPLVGNDEREDDIRHRLDRDARSEKTNAFRMGLKPGVQRGRCV